MVGLVLLIKGNLSSVNHAKFYTVSFSSIQVIPLLRTYPLSRIFFQAVEVDLLFVIYKKEGLFLKYLLIAGSSLDQ